MSKTTLDRRDVLRAGLMVGAGVALGGIAPAPVAAQSLTNFSPNRKRVLRLAHLTDTHVQPEKAGGEGMAACLRHVQSRPEKPELILFGGDNLINVDGGTGRRPERAKVQLDLWQSVLKNECSIPYRTAIGNHDILALNPTDGKKWATDAFGLDRRYYHFDQAGWRFVVLDSTSPEGGGYKGRLDEEQFDWLANLLRDTPRSTPVFVLSHIPIICFCAVFDGDNEKSGNWQVPGAWMHIDARKIKDLFFKHKHVKVAASGHIHLADRVEYLGVSYLCNGAVSGGWWGGPCQEFGPGYGLIDLFDDGSCDSRYVEFGWTARD